MSISSPKNFYPSRGKRIFDSTASLCALLLLSPLIGIVAGLVRIFLGAPVFFCQKRAGWHGQPFVIYKFRSMTDAKDAQGQLLPDKERLPTFGRFLRSSSLDELPALWNVLTGDMSLVGPRPLLLEYLPLYTLEQLRRHNVRPGITGWAQVNGRNTISWEQKFALDIWYADHVSIGLDLRILWLTIKKVWIREGIVQEGQVSAEKFRGTQL
ncbi:MAG: sugar transferase [Caldilineaceae bacterium]